MVTHDISIWLLLHKDHLLYGDSIHFYMVALAQRPSPIWWLTIFLYGYSCIKSLSYMVTHDISIWWLLHKVPLLYGGSRHFYMMSLA